MSYVPLKTDFTSQGFKYLQLKRIGDVAIFKQSKSKRIVSFEVIIVKRHEGYTLKDTWIEPAEIYPSTSQWGSSGWTFKDIKKAEEKFDEISKSLYVKKRSK